MVMYQLVNRIFSISIFFAWRSCLARASMSSGTKSKKVSHIQTVHLEFCFQKSSYEKQKM